MKKLLPSCQPSQKLLSMTPTTSFSTSATMTICWTRQGKDRTWVWWLKLAVQELVSTLTLLFPSQGFEAESEALLCLLHNHDPLNDNDLLRLQWNPKHGGSLWQEKKKGLDGWLCGWPGGVNFFGQDFCQHHFSNRRTLLTLRVSPGFRRRRGRGKLKVDKMIRPANFYLKTTLYQKKNLSPQRQWRGGHTKEGWAAQGPWGQVPLVLDDHHLHLDHLHRHHHSLLPGMHPQRLRHQQLFRLDSAANINLESFLSVFRFP